MASRKSYNRFFIILQEDEKGYGIDTTKTPSGYAKLETMNDKAKASFYVQNLRKQKGPYNMVLIVEGKDGRELINLGTINIDDMGKADVSSDYSSDNIANTHISMDEVEGAAICKISGDRVGPVMVGFAGGEEYSNWYKFPIASRTDKRDKVFSIPMEKAQKKEEKKEPYKEASTPKVRSDIQNDTYKCSKEEYEEFKAEKEKLEADREELKNEQEKLKSAQDKLDSDLLKLNEDIDKNRLEKEKLEADTIRVNAAREQLNKDILEFNKEKDAFSSQKDKLDEDRAQLEREKAELDKEREDFNRLRNEFNKDKAELDGEKADFNSLKDEFDKEKDAFDIEKEQFNKDKATFNSEKDRLSKEKDALNKQKEAFNKEKEAFNKEKQEFEASKKEQGGLGYGAAKVKSGICKYIKVKRDDGEEEYVKAEDVGQENVEGQSFEDYEKEIEAYKEMRGKGCKNYDDDSDSDDDDDDYKNKKDKKHKDKDKDKKKKEPKEKCMTYPKEKKEEFFNGVVKDLEKIGENDNIKNCKWYKASVDKLESMYCVYDYNKYSIIFYPMICYYPYIAKSKEFMIGYKYDDDDNLRYIIYAIHGTKDLKDQPYEGKTGFVTFMPDEDDDNRGYWLMYYDIDENTVVVPIKRA